MSTEKLFKALKHAEFVLETVVMLQGARLDPQALVSVMENLEWIRGQVKQHEEDVKL